MKKIVINKCYGGFSLSHKAMLEYAKIAGFKLYGYVSYRDETRKIDFDKMIPYNEKDEPFIIYYSKKKLTRNINKQYNNLDKKDYFSSRDFARDDPILIKVVESLGAAANDADAELKIVEIPDNVEWEVTEYDGLEKIEEKHKIWD
jgi:hypothetical protein